MILCSLAGVSLATYALTPANRFIAFAMHLSRMREAAIQAATPVTPPPAEARPGAPLQPANMTQVWVPPRSAAECRRRDGVIDTAVLDCMSGYYILQPLR